MATIYILFLNAHMWFIFSASRALFCFTGMKTKHAPSRILPVRVQRHQYSREYCSFICLMQKHASVNWL